MSELIDIVDENNNVVGQGTREDAAQQKMWKRTVNALIFNDEGEVIVQWRSISKYPNQPRMFDTSVGGHVDSGENSEQAIYREMEEELGIQTPLTLIFEGKDEPTRKHVALYLGFHNGPFSNWEEEAEALEFFTVDELEHFIGRIPYAFTNGFKQAFEEYKKYLNLKEK